jgi:SnoaL-like domain
MEPADTPSAIRAFIDATNAGDSDAFAAAFTPDATLSDWGRKYTGHGGVRDWDRTDNIGVHSHFDLLAIEPGVDVLRTVGEVLLTEGSADLTFRRRARQQPDGRHRTACLAPVASGRQPVGTFQLDAWYPCAAGPFS